MSSRGRWALVLGSLLAVGALGTWGCCTVRCSPGGRALVKVDARLLGSHEPIVLSKKKHDEIVWKLEPGSPYTRVAIELKGHPDPFVSCKTEAGICWIPCDRQTDNEHAARFCFSDSINPLLDVPTSGIYYDYHFNGTTATSSDPGIRIDP